MATRLESQIAAGVNLANSIPDPFDQHLLEGISDQEAGRTAGLRTIVALEDQTDTIVDAAEKIGIRISVT